MSVAKGLKLKLLNRTFTFTFSKFLLYLLMIMLLAFTSLPLVYLVVTAFKPIDELLLFPPRFFVSRPTLDNFSDLFIALSSATVPFIRYIFNSIITTLGSVLGSIVVCTLAAFAITKHHVPLGNFFYMLIIAALMFPGQTTQIPSYMIVSALGLFDSPFALIIPKIAGASYMFMMRQFCLQLPNEFLESARIDGAGEMRIFFKIVFPFLAPAWATLLVFSFVANWNDYFSPLIYISNESWKTLPLALASISQQGSIAREGAVAAIAFLMTAPTIVIFTAMQSKVIETMSHSGIKA